MMGGSEMEFDEFSGVQFDLFNSKVIEHICKMYSVQDFFLFSVSNLISSVLKMSNGWKRLGIIK